MGRSSDAYGGDEEEVLGEPSGVRQDGAEEGVRDNCSERPGLEDLGQHSDDGAESGLWLEVRVEDEHVSLLQKLFSEGVGRETGESGCCCRRHEGAKAS